LIGWDVTGDKQVKCTQELAKWQKNAIERIARRCNGTKPIGLMPEKLDYRKKFAGECCRGLLN